jgi:thiamine-phosphate diphosphorylase
MRVPRLHAITDDARLADARFVEDAAALLEAGGSELALHLRGRWTTAARLFELATTLLPVARAHGAFVLVNDRVDVALATRADGVQLRETSIDVAAARAILGSEATIGVSRHAGSIGRDEDRDADFVIVGNVFATATHPGSEPLGLDGLSRLVDAARDGYGRWIPLIAIGGVTAERMGAVVQAGAFGVAAMSGIWEGGASAVHAYAAQLGSPGAVSEA